MILEQACKAHIKAHRHIHGDQHHLPRSRMVGVGMRTHAGRRLKACSAPCRKEGINILMISTSEIKISVVIDEKYLELAVRVLHRAFGLDQAAA
jgi:aspartate kinase